MIRILKTLLLFILVMNLIADMALGQSQLKNQTGVPLKGVVTYKNGNTYSFDHVAEHSNLSGDEFRCVEKHTAMTGIELGQITSYRIKLKFIKSIKTGDTIEKEKKWISSNQEKQIKCTWIEVTVVNRNGKEFKDLLISTKEGLACGSNHSSSSLVFVQSDMQARIALSSIKKIEFE